MISTTEPRTLPDENNLPFRPPQPTVERVVRPMPDRYRNPIGRFKVRRSADCRGCAVCVEICPYGVHVKPAGYNLPLRPRDYLCIGPKCAATNHYCVEHCPNKALSVGRNPTAEAIGDPRWTPDLLLSTWRAGGDRSGRRRRPGVPPRRLGRRLRRAPLPLPGETACCGASGGDRHPPGAQPPRRRPAGDRHRLADLRRRDVVRLGQRSM